MIRERREESKGRKGMNTLPIPLLNLVDRPFPLLFAPFRSPLLREGKSSMVPGLITSLLLPASKPPSSSPVAAMTVPQEYAGETTIPIRCPGLRYTHHEVAEVVAKLPDLQQVVQQQRPWMAGQPFQMKVYGRSMKMMTPVLPGWIDY